MVSRYKKDIALPVKELEILNSAADSPAKMAKIRLSPVIFRVT